jgi:hypothetical protein
MISSIIITNFMHIEKEKYVNTCLLNPNGIHGIIFLYIIYKEQQI